MYVTYTILYDAVFFYKIENVQFELNVKRAYTEPITNQLHGAQSFFKS
jgi:hypothetical protein